MYTPPADAPTDARPAAQRAATPRAALVATGLRKSYGDRVAVADVSLAVHAGEVLGLLGPNGAGKSTTVGLLCGLIAPDAGRVVVGDGKGDGGGDRLASGTDAFKRRIGLVPQDLALYEDLPAAANLTLFGALYGLPRDRARQRAAEVLALVGLSDRARDRPATFSGGMKRRLNIAAALVHDPDVLLLDEPTAGVDPQSRNAIFDGLEALKAQGKALVYTTHYMEEAERLADRIVIIDHGRVVASGTQAELAGAVPSRESLEIELDGAAGPELLKSLAALPGVTQVRRGSAGRPDLEAVFLALTGRQLRD